MKEFHTFCLEKTILGLIEDLQVEGLGTVSAKLDTGNGAYNVIHGEDIECDENMVRFTTINNFRMEVPMEEKITINVGAGNKEERPVCSLNCIIGGKKFPNVKFSIGNRSDNLHKILIGKNFIQNELDALIDVSLQNVADKGLNI